VNSVRVNPFLHGALSWPELDWISIYSNLQSVPLTDYASIPAVQMTGSTATQNSLFLLHRRPRFTHRQWSPERGSSSHLWCFEPARVTPN